MTIYVEGLLNFLGHLAGLWQIQIHLPHAWLKVLDAWGRQLVRRCAPLLDIFVYAASKYVDWLFQFWKFFLYLFLSFLSFSIWIYLYIFLINFFIRSEFNKLLDDTPLPVNEVSSSVLVATYIASSLNGKAAVRGGKPSTNGEVEKGLLTLFSSDNPGIQVYFYLLITVLTLSSVFWHLNWS